MLQLYFYPDPILKQECLEVGLKDNPESPQFGEEKLVEFIAGMRRSLYGYNGKGIAAPQVGWPIRVFMMMIDDEPTTFINPVVLEHGGEKILTQEQCLSIPVTTAKLRRSRLIRVSYYTEEGAHVSDKVLQDDDAIAFQHELDHMDGILLFNRMGSAQRQLKKKRCLKWVKKNIQNQTKQG